jgi:DNA-binding IclR family transcriptional regulator
MSQEARPTLGRVGVLDKAIAILDALEGGPLTLAELTEATGQKRATAHRLARAMVEHGLLAKDRSRFLLGHRLVEIGAAASAGPVLADASRPCLEQLRDVTGESVQLYVPAGSSRVCVVALDSPHSLRTIVAVGAVLPMDRGSAGAVLGDRPDMTRQGWVESVEEREKGVTSVSAPVRRDGRVVAAVSVSGPVDRTTRSPGKRYSEAVVAAARRVEDACGWR